MKRFMVLGLGSLALVFGFLLISNADLTAEVPDRKKVPEFIAALKDTKAGTSRRLEAARELGRLGQVIASAARPAIPTLLSVLAKDSDTAVRRAAAESLGQIASEPETVVPALVKVLNDDKEPMTVRAGAAAGLGYMGSDARGAIGDLKKIASEFKGKDMSKDKQALAKAAQGALKMITPKKK